MPEFLYFYLAVGAGLVVAASVALWVRALRRVAVPENRRVFVSSWILGAALGVAALVLGGPGGWSSAPAWFAVLMACLLLFTFTISKQILGDNAIRVGDRIPAFTAPDEYGELFDSRSVDGQLLLIKFFRGHW